MDDHNRIHSLCISVIIPADGRKRLYRIADVLDGKLEPYYFDRDRFSTRVGVDVDSIQCRETDFKSEGLFGFWEWYSPDGIGQRAYPDAQNLTWFEYISVDRVKSLEELKVALLNGINTDPIQEHDYLVGFSVVNENSLVCIYCKASDFAYKNGKIFLNDDIYYRKVYEIRKSDIEEMHIHIKPDFRKQYFRYTLLPQESRNILLRTPPETVRQVVIKRIKKCTEGLSRSDRSIINNFIRGDFNDNILESIIAECGCEREEAKLYLNEFIQKCEQYFTADDFSKQLMIKLIDSDSGTAQKYKQVVREEWEQESTEKIERANELLSEAHNQFQFFAKQRDELQTEIERLVRLKGEEQTKVVKIQQEYNDQLNMADGIASRIRERMEDAKTDLSRFLAEYSVFLPNTVDHVKKDKESYIVGGISISETLDIVDLFRILDCLAKNLKTVGVSKTKTLALGSYLLASYFRKTPLIMAGYGAKSIVDALSASLFNKTADMLFVKNISDRIIFPSNGEIVAVYDGLGTMNKILDFADSQRIFFIVQSFEELVIEPRSLYNYALPLCTDFFVTNECVTGGLSGSVLDDGGEKFSEIAMETDLPRWVIPELGLIRAETLVGTAKSMHDKLTAQDIMLLSTIPIMLSLSMKTELLEIIKSASLRNDIEKSLLMMIGEPEND